jgi:hypothetical protein
MIGMGWRYKMDYLEGGFDLFQGLGKKRGSSSAEISSQSVAEQYSQSRQRVLWGMVLARIRSSGTNQSEERSVC